MPSSVCQDNMCDLSTEAFPGGWKHSGHLMSILPFLDSNKSHTQPSLFTQKMRAMGLTTFKPRRAIKPSKPRRALCSPWVVLSIPETWGAPGCLCQQELDHNIIRSQGCAWIIIDRQRELLHPISLWIKGIPSEVY